MALRSGEGLTKARNPAIDFTKGVLVLCMVIYHAANYMLGVHVDLKYLSFLPPSFIFITGFLITAIYLPKFRASHTAVRRRLIVRGARLLLVFTALNMGAAFVISKNYNNLSIGIDDFLDNAISIYLSGNGRGAIFEVLVPISYLLVLSALLLALCEVGKWFFPVLCGALFLVIGILAQYGVVFEILNLLAVGVLGMAFGCIPDRQLNHSARFFYLVGVSYAAYLWAITKWSVFYWLQVIGACLSVALIYMIGQKVRENSLSRQIVLLGQYSLVTYILQIAVLQVLLRILPHGGVVWGNFALSVLVTSVVIVIAAQVLRSLRARSKAVDHCYRAVFA